MKLSEVVVIHVFYNFTKFHQKQKSFINSPFFCSEFQSVSRIVKIIHSATTVNIIGSKSGKYYCFEFGAIFLLICTKKGFINSPFFCSEFQIMIRIMKIVHSVFASKAKINDF